MYKTAHILALSAIALSSSMAAPTQTSPTDVNCNDVTTGLDPSCWAKLNMTSWLTEWAENTPGASGSASIETPAGDSGSDTASSPGNFTSGGDDSFRRRSAGCETDELWSTCFLRLELGGSGEDCSKIDLGGGDVSCLAPKVGTPPQTPQLYYGVWNIYAVNNYISSAYAALEEVSQEKQAAIESAATTGPGGVAYNFPASYSVDIVLIQLLFKQTNNRESAGSPNTPLADLLEASPSKQMYSEETDVDQLTLWMQDSLASALTYIMSDLPTFVKFAASGAFSTTNLTSVASLVAAFEA